MPETFAGMPAEDALQRVLRLRGERGARPELDGGGSMGSMLHELDARGIDARLAAIGAGDLRFVDAPALLQLHDGTWLVLNETRDGELVVEGLEGLYRVPAASLRPHIMDMALQLLPESPRTRSIWSRVAALLLERPAVLLQIAGASLLMVLLALIPPQIIRVTVDRALPSGAVSLLRFITIGLVLVTAFQAWTGWLRARMILYVKSRTEAILETEFLAHLLSLPFAFLNGKTMGQLLQGFAGLGAARGLLTDQGLGAAVDGVTAVLYLAVMLSTMPGPTAGVVVAALIMGVIGLIVGRLQAAVQGRETEAQARQRDFLIELLTGMATVKASGSETRGLREWLQRLGVELALRLRRQRIGIWSDLGLATIHQALTVVLLIWGGSLALRGQSTIGSLLAFLQMSAGFLTAVLGLIGTYLTIQLLKPRLAELAEARAVEPEPRSRRAARALSLAGPVVMDKVWFRYRPDAPWVLRELDMEVQPGEKRWIRGPSGVGKSTILRLISGLYSPERGRIRIGGRDPIAAHGLMTYLPQIIQLYGGSIMENLRMFSGNAPRERIVEAARASGLEALIARLPMGYETVMPPGGMTLSGGERQLVAMTAVMASERSLFLLDEALVSLDWIGRSSVENNRWFDGKTVIYASHDGDATGATSTFLRKEQRLD